MRRTTPRGLAALAMLAIGAGQLLAPAAEATGFPGSNGTSMSGMAPNHASPNGANLNGMSMNGVSPNGVGLNGLRINGANLKGFGAQGTSFQGTGPQGGDPGGRGAEAVDPGALALRAVRLPDGRVLPVARE
jgi:hypothetical protein